MFKDKVIVITGASSGIGMAAAREFANRGAKVVIAARDYNKLLSLSNELVHLTEVLPVKCDVTIEDDCKNLIDKCIEKFGSLDILVNNAGISMRALFIETEISVLKQLMDVNFSR